MRGVSLIVPTYLLGVGTACGPCAGPVFVTPTFLDFDEVEVGSTAEWTDFAGGDAVDVTVSYAPEEAGDHDAFLYLASTLAAGHYAVIEARGTGVQAP